MNGLIRKLIKSMGIRWLTGQVRAAAEGKLGPKWKAAYWKIAGAKRWISFTVGLLAAATALAGYTRVAEAIGIAAGFGFSVAWVDAKWRDTSDAHWLYDHPAWVFLANNSPTITTLLLASLGWLHGSTCTLGADWCSYSAVAVTILGCACAQTGLVDAAWNSPAPSPSPFTMIESVVAIPGGGKKDIETPIKPV